MKLDAIIIHNNFPERFGWKGDIKTMRYDYSEPQHGKDICDRIRCPMKHAIQKYCNEGRDIFTASDMRRALLERPLVQPPPQSTE